MSSVGYHLKGQKERKKENLLPWVKVDQAIRPLPPKSLDILILVGLTLKLYSLCIIVSVVASLERFERSESALWIYEVYNEAVTSPATETRFENNALRRQIDQVDQLFPGRCLEQLEGNHTVGFGNLWRIVWVQKTKRICGSTDLSTKILAYLLTFSIYFLNIDILAITYFFYSLNISILLIVFVTHLYKYQHILSYFYFYTLLMG